MMTLNNIVLVVGVILFVSFVIVALRDYITSPAREKRKQLEERLLTLRLRWQQHLNQGPDWLPMKKEELLKLLFPDEWGDRSPFLVHNAWACYESVKGLAGLGWWADMLEYLESAIQTALERLEMLEAEIRLYQPIPASAPQDIDATFQ